MFRKITTYIGIALLVALFGAYFYFASSLRSAGMEKEVCSGIKVVILDSAVNRFVSEKEVKDILIKSDAKPLGKKIKDLSINELEELLNKRSAIKKGDVSISRDGMLYASITQRRPLLRIESREGGFYIDETLYIFPLINTFTSYVPVVTGDIPIKLKPDFRGVADGEDSKWLESMLRFGNYIYRSEFWNAQVQQINIRPNGDMVLYTRVGDQAIVFGGFENFEYKFRKLEAFYQNVVPVKGWNRYSEINLKFSDQIVCTTKKTKSKKQK